MRMNKFSKLAALALTGGLVLSGGCSFGGLANNVWKGFGYSLGGIPANILSDFVLANFIVDDTDNDGA